MSELKPCPFCGNKELIRDTYYAYDGYQGETPEYRILCKKCMTVMKHEHKDRLTLNWNRRVKNETENR